MAGSTLVTEEMVRALERDIDDLLQRFDMPSDFMIPGENSMAAALDLARTIVRRAERLAVGEPGRGVPRDHLPQPTVRLALGDGALAGGTRAQVVPGGAD